MADFLKKLKFNKDGIIPAIIQDFQTNEVLMLGYMNEHSLLKTILMEKVHFWSRSRRKLWLKGERSGHFQTVMEICFDCDADALLIKVKQKGGACHKGYRSCFYRRFTKDRRVEITGKKIFNPEKVYNRDA